MADKATIVLFSHVSNTRSITGAEKLLLFFGRELSRFFDCILVAPHEGKLTRQARSFGLNVQLMPIPLLYGMYTPYAGLPADARQLQESREYRELTDWLVVLRPAFIITSTCVHVLPAMAAKSLGIPVVWKISEAITDNEYTGISVDLIHRNSDEILAISHTAAACFPHEMMVDKVTLLPPSWNDEEMMAASWSKLRGERRLELRVQPHQKLVGYISSFINKEKGLEHFVDMAVIVAAAQRDAKFLVIGTPGDKSFYDRCVRKVKMEGLHSRFQFVGYENCLPAAYCAMDVLVVPSLIREGFGMTALEGMSFGKPVVAYASGGLQEILQAGGCGDYLVPVENTVALADAVKALLAEPGHAAAIGNRARELAEAAYGPAAYRMRLHGLAERWNLRYCSSPPAAIPVAAVPPPGPAVPGESEPPAAAEPRRGTSRRASRLRRRKIRRGRLRRAKDRARRRGRPSAIRRASRKRRSKPAARRKRSGGKRSGSKRRSSARRTKGRRKAA
ncbi:glycosyltransferase [Paenibacillus sp. NPDC058177]|uniref:glycosyltransferase n=1 Tax=Paenibacillus sp. NPDC058177 TaxID=3346369 RepID=UPI0036D90009